MPEEHLHGEILRIQKQNQLGSQTSFTWGPSGNVECRVLVCSLKVKISSQTWNLCVLGYRGHRICIVEKCLRVIKNLLVMADTCIHFSIQVQGFITPECSDISFWGKLRRERKGDNNDMNCNPLEKVGSRPSNGSCHLPHTPSFLNFLHY